MIKVLLCFAIVFICGFMGYGISKCYLQRKKFFFCLSNFLITLKTDISFGAKSLTTIVENGINHSNSNSEFKLLLENYLKILNNLDKVEMDNLFKGIMFLTVQERESILMFFQNLGKIDSYSQIEEINKFFITSENYYITAKDDSKKYGSLYIKLGVIIGAFVSILII